jgi:hypothetical protein
MLSDIKLSVIMLTVVMLSVILLSVMTQQDKLHCYYMRTSVQIAGYYASQCSYSRKLQS